MISKEPVFVHEPLNDLAASSHRGGVFLIAFGTTWIVWGLLAYRLPAAGHAVAAMFEGASALAMAFGLQKLLGGFRMSTPRIRCPRYPSIWQSRRRSRFRPLS